MAEITCPICQSAFGDNWLCSNDDCGYTASLGEVAQLRAAGVEAPPEPEAGDTPAIAAPQSATPVGSGHVEAEALDQYRLDCAFPNGAQESLMLIESQQVVLGRGYDSPIGQHLENDRAVSREHAVIEVSRGQVLLHDRESTYKTWVDGRQILPWVKVRLQQAGTIRLGPSSTISYTISEEGGA